MGRSGGGREMGIVGWARRLRRRMEWLAVILVLLSVPVLWLLFQQAIPAAVHTAPAPPETAPPETAPPEADTPEMPATTRRLRAEGAPAKREAPRVDRCDDPLVLVDREHALPPDYAPADLVPLRNLGVPTLGGNTLLRREAAENLARLVSAAAASGEELTVSSAYRSYEEQRASYARLVSIYGKGADRTSAPPGHSQHQLGTAVDFTNGAVGYEVHRDFGLTTAFRWLRTHAHEHGFVLAYPVGGEAETGYRWEPWHYRYVGPDNARRIGESKLGLQGFLEQNGVAPRC